MTGCMWMQLMQGIYASMSTLDAQAIQEAGQAAQNGSFSHTAGPLHASPSQPRLIVTGQMRGGRIVMEPPTDLLQV